MSNSDKITAKLVPDWPAARIAAEHVYSGSRALKKGLKSGTAGALPAIVIDMGPSDGLFGPKSWVLPIESLEDLPESPQEPYEPDLMRALNHRSRWPKSKGNYYIPRRDGDSVSSRIQDYLEDMFSEGDIESPRLAVRPDAADTPIAGDRNSALRAKLIQVARKLNELNENESSPEGIVAHAATLESEKKLPDALDLIYKSVDSLFKRGAIGRINQLLSLVVEVSSSEHVAIALLTATHSERERLSAYRAAYEYLVNYLRKNGEYDERIISGLEY